MDVAQEVVHGWACSRLRYIRFNLIKFVNAADVCIVVQSLAQLLCEMRDVNKALQFEVDDLKQKLKDANGDIKVCFYNVSSSLSSSYLACTSGVHSSTCSQQPPEWPVLSHVDCFSRCEITLSVLTS